VFWGWGGPPQSGMNLFIYLFFNFVKGVNSIASPYTNIIQNSISLTTYAKTLGNIAILRWF
jgi:hypothetical protein